MPKKRLGEVLCERGHIGAADLKRALQEQQGKAIHLGEGQNEEILVKPPNLSKRGMFINTSRTFPEGAVLNLRFALVLTGAEVRTRCEVAASERRR
jgi:hypothetical protein